MTKHEWKRIMFLHVQSGGCICYLCGKLIEKQKDFSLDHSIPLSRGGKDDETNWRGSCKKCNWTKGALTVEEFKLWKQLERLRNGNVH